MGKWGIEDDSDFMNRVILLCHYAWEFACVLVIITTAAGQIIAFLFEFSAEGR
jgi:hypothetical protein